MDEPRDLQSLEQNKGVLGIYIHRLKNKDGTQSVKGANPFDEITFGNDRIRLSGAVKAYDPPYSESTSVYSHIKDNLSNWIEQAISIRADN